MAANTARYETLLRKSNQDDLLKNWELTLSYYLDDFMAHLQEHTEHMNFSEAAMLLQNSTTFYCKRVDIVHKIIQELVVEISNMRGSGENEDIKKNGPSVRRKKATKSLEMDDLQLLDFVAAEHSIDVPIEKIAFRGVPKQIVLCSSVKALRKGGTSVTVYQSNGNILGCKEEFRIFGKTYSDGTVNEDFNFDDEKIINRVDECEDDTDVDDLRDDSFHMDIDEMAAEAVPPESQQELDTQIPEKSALPVSPSLPVTTKEYAAAAKSRRKKNVEWEPVPYNFKVFIKPFKLISRTVVPSKVLSEEMVEGPDKLTIGRKRKRRLNGEEEKMAESVKLTWMDIAIKDGLVDASNSRLKIEMDIRKELLKSHAKEIQRDVFLELDDAMGAVDDEPDDFEDLVDDNDAVVCSAPLTKVDEIISAESTNLYVDEALKAIEKFKENRREHASKATDVAKRVAAWHESIMPVLEAAESRSKFDVHEYGSRILTMFPDDDHDTFRPFRNVVVEQPKNEICRYFLSTLMLANTYNLEIRKGELGLLVKDCVELRLITKVRHHEEMDEALRMAAEDCGS